MEHSIFLVGGYHLDADVCSVKVFELDLRNEQWIESCEIPRTCTVNCGASLSNGEIYIFGGHDSISGETSTSIDRFNFANKKWTEWASIPSVMFLNSVVFAEEDSSFYFSGDLTGTTSESGMRRDTETLLRPSADELWWKDRQAGIFHAPGSKLWRISPDTQKSQEVPTKTTLMDAPITLISESSVFSCGGFDG
ncbi:hypothetical protein RvY_03944-2 [Ramazzottius varieornatus]|uniref:Uncharacterized protein n=1 Tax=Ramazzottius varieornatus TaxID=947166 RepID=A0A1D1UZX6_RAMVA|nr:hypothetical protein RvY_03944-2 [Ramazzottius varieornatus]